MKSSLPSSMRFILMPSANPPEHLLGIHNSAYQLWLEIWKEELQKLHFDDSNLVDEFIRQDLIACITHEDKPVAVHLYSFLSIDSQAARDHRYFKNNYPPVYFEKLANHSVRNVMSMEYMTVHPDWRKVKDSLHIGGTLGGLAVRTMQHFGCDAAIAPCRRDHKVHEMAYAYGGKAILPEVMNHNVACDLVMIHTNDVKAHPVTNVQHNLEILWGRKEIHLSHEHQQLAKVLAFPAIKKAA